MRSPTKYGDNRQYYSNDKDDYMTSIKNEAFVRNKMSVYIIYNQALTFIFVRFRYYDTAIAFFARTGKQL